MANTNHFTWKATFKNNFYYNWWNKYLIQKRDAINQNKWKYVAQSSHKSGTRVKQEC